jgi:hypothetical protein
MKYGLIQQLPEFVEYMLGRSEMPLIPYNEKGDWEKYLPRFEHQAETWETNGCTVYATLNQIETFYKFLYRVEPNYSERFTYLLTPVNPSSGAYPHNVYECIRKRGILTERLLDEPEDKEEYLNDEDISGSHYAFGQFWLQRHDFMHEWVWNGRPEDWKERLKHALKTSPVAVSVTAWYKDENGKYIDRNRKNNHWCLAYKFDDEGVHIFDHYDQQKKILAPDHRIQMAKRIWLNKKTRTALRRHESLLKRILKKLLMQPDIVTIVKSYIGKDASPADYAPDELGCAESVTTILKKLYPETPIITGTWTLWDYLQKNYVRMNSPEVGCVVISPTGTSKLGSKVPYPGHAGFVLDNDTIASNDSFTGRFEINYDLSTWAKRYVEKGGYKMYYYKHK